MESKSYLESWTLEFFEESIELGPMYTNHLGKFLDYVKSVGKENSIMDITEEDLKHSVEYQYNLGNIKTTTSLSNHLEVIKSFYIFLQKKRFCDNIFNTISDYPKFKQNIKEEFNLAEKVDRLALPNDVGIQLLKYFENDIFNKDNNYMIIKLFVKLMLIAPAKRKILADLKFRDFDKDFRWVIVNGVKIKINNSLRNDILKSIEKNCKNGYTDEDIFFEALYDRVYSHNIFNSPMYKVLRDIDYIEKSSKNPTYPVESIMNMALVNMIENDVNPLLIAKINGVSLGRLEEKIKKLCISGINKVITNDSLINDSISSLEYYQYI